MVMVGDEQPAPREAGKRTPPPMSWTTQPRNNGTRSRYPQTAKMEIVSLAAVC